MRWDHLFDDLESQLETHLAAEEGDLDADEERSRLGRLSVRDRLVALRAAGHPVTLTLTTGVRLTLDIDAVGADWLSARLVERTMRAPRCVVPFGSVASVRLAAGQVEPSLSGGGDARGGASVSMRLGLPFVLRDLCRRRWPVDLVLDATTQHGTIDRVGRDHLDLAMHEAGMARRPEAVREVRIVPLERIALVGY
jgi:hypothetical protein